MGAEKENMKNIKQINELLPYYRFQGWCFALFNYRKTLKIEALAQATEYWYRVHMVLFWIEETVGIPQPNTPRYSSS